MSRIICSILTVKQLISCQDKVERIYILENWLELKALITDAH